MDEYDNIDCDLLLEFFGGETAPGPSRLGYENNSYNKQFNGENPSATGSTEQHSSMYDRESNSNVKPFAVVDIKKEKSIMNSTKSKKQRLGPDESQEQGMNSEMAPTQSNQEQFHYGNNDGSPAKETVTAKSSTSKIIQLEASKDRRRLVFSD